MNDPDQSTINALEQAAEDDAVSAHPDGELTLTDNSDLEAQLMHFFGEAEQYLLQNYGDTYTVQPLRIMFQGNLYALAAIIPPYENQAYSDLRRHGVTSEHSQLPDNWPENDHIVTIKNEIYDDRSLTDAILAELYASQLLTQSGSFITAEQPRQDISLDMLDYTPEGSLTTAVVSDGTITITKAPADTNSMRHACFMPIIITQINSEANQLTATRAYTHLQSSEAPYARITLLRLDQVQSEDAPAAGILPRYWEQV